MITIIFAPPGYGKTCYLTHVLNEYAYNRERNRAMQCEVLNKKQNGFKVTAPQHCVSANYDCKFKKFGYSPRVNRKINPYRLGYYNDFVKVHFNMPYEVIGIDEAQKYLNSRMSMYFPEWQSRWYEQHRHNNLEIFLATQRPMLIDVNIRELAQFVEIIKLVVKYNDMGQPNSLIWTIRKIENSQLFDKYMSSGRKDDTCYMEEEVTANYNVFALYDSQSCKPKFYDGHFDQDFDYTSAEPVGTSIEDYINYLEEFDEELPNNFYRKRGT